MAVRYTVDHESTPEDMLRLLALAKNKEGRKIDIENFDRDSAKPLHRLFAEAKNAEALLTYNPETGRFERHARSARNTLYELRRKKVWLEVARSYPSGKLVKNKKTCTSSETLKLLPLEAPIDGAIRCYVEEMREALERLAYMPKATDLIPVLDDEGKEKCEIDEHESTVYDGILSIVEVYSYDLYLDFHDAKLSLGEEILIVKDVNGDATNDNNWTKTYLRAEDYKLVA